MSDEKFNAAETLQAAIEGARMSESVTGESCIKYLAALGFKVLAREPSAEMIIAVNSHAKANEDWRSMWDAAP